PYPTPRQHPMAFWLAKTEPDEYSIDDVARAPQTPLRWDGVRHSHARNYRGQMGVGDLVFVDHSHCRAIGIAGIARVSTAASPDPSQFDPDSPYHDSRSTPDNPRWLAVDMVHHQRFERVLSLTRIKSLPGLEGLPLIQRGSRLSVMPVT